MKTHPLKPRQALNKAFLKVKPNRSDMERFKTNLICLLEQTNDTESEEFHKNLVSDFLKKTYYDPGHFINTKGRNDLVIHNGPKASNTVGVILETKKPTNKSEMPTPEKLNTKAFHELVLYYMGERISHKNLEIKHLVITNIYEWFIFDVSVFERLFAQNITFVKQFEDFIAGRLADPRTDFFYRHIAGPFTDSITQEIEFTHFNLQDYRDPLINQDKIDDHKLIALYKLLSPEHLLKLPFANDSNSLDKTFYKELLHIIGLAETKQGGKKLIERPPEGQRHEGALLENAIIQLDSLDKIGRLERPGQYGANQQERLFNVALELCISWMNRILFLKLMEAQLLSYHKKDKSYEFLSYDKIHNYDALNKLFFQVLARKYEDRPESVNRIFNKVPYLNSSLFEPNDLEHSTLLISNLEDDYMLPLYTATVLKDDKGKRLTGRMNTLQYLFAFLNAYDFSSEGSEEIQEENKSLINASVLGLIFEKINGYKDGSFFTPGFITMYMCRETIRRAVVQKFFEPLKDLTPRPPLQNREGEVGSANQQYLQSGEGVVEELPPTVETGLPKELLAFARELRKNQTETEEILWQLLRNRKLGGFKFRRQHPISEGFILDFYCAEVRLAIELDGAYHKEEKQQEYDEGRTYELEKYGIKVIRFWNNEIEKDIELVLTTILMEANQRKNVLTPLPHLQNGEGVGGEEKTMERGPGSGQEPNLTNVYNLIGTRYTIQDANTIINSLKICDPAVGSGHFLVSALNEILAIKSELGILCDRQGRRLRDYHLEVVNDELIITDEEGQIFEYHPGSPESQRVQEALFHEKQTIIENCLFGVDINPNSVKICRLRLWIELLKNAYYLTPSPPLQFGEGVGGEVKQLETLPNIDINIKRGNSLVSRFALDADLGQALKKSKWNIESYRLAVQTYRNAHNKEEKRAMEKLIADIKSDFRSEISDNDPKLRRLKKLKGELFTLTNQTALFEQSKKEKEEWNKKLHKLTSDMEKLEAEIEEIRNNKIYENAFEWRFEFPEVLNENGEFTGFDVVIGNPPYIRQEELGQFKAYLKEHYKVYAGTADLLVYFFELSMNILKKNGHFCMITSNKFVKANYGKSLRNYLRQFQLTDIIDFGELPVFEEAATFPAIYQANKSSEILPVRFIQVKNLNFTSLHRLVNTYSQFLSNEAFGNDFWSLGGESANFILEKLRIAGKSLGEYVNGEILYGIKTGFNNAFVIDENKREELIAEDPRSAEIIFPFANGDDVRFYQIRDKRRYIILSKIGVDINRYPAIFKHFKQHQEKLEKRWDKGEHWWELRACAYYDIFDKAKIVYPVIAKEPRFAISKTTLYSNDKTFLIPRDDLYLLGYLNSSLSWFYLKNICSVLGDAEKGGRLELRSVHVSTLPIFPANEMQKREIQLLVKKIIEIKDKNPEADVSSLQQEIDRLVYELYGLTEEEIGIVENSNK